MNRRPVHEQVNLIISCFMAVLYVGGGIFLIASSYSFGYLKAGSPERIALAVLLLLYGLFRGRRAWKAYQHRNDL